MVQELRLSAPILSCLPFIALGGSKVNLERNFLSRVAASTLLLLVDVLVAADVKRLGR
jgi:hypothetical protein